MKPLPTVHGPSATATKLSCSCGSSWVLIRFMRSNRVCSTPARSLSRTVALRVSSASRTTAKGGGMPAPMRQQTSTTGWANDATGRLDAGQRVGSEVLVHGFREKTVGRDQARTALRQFFAVIEHVDRGVQVSFCAPS